jgi:NADH:ubiquinone oxidoreductase subunit 3 (subunit A)
MNKYVKLVITLLVAVAFCKFCMYAYGKVDQTWQRKQKKEISRLQNDLEVLQYAISVIPTDTRKNIYPSVCKNFGDDDDAANERIKLQYYVAHLLELRVKSKEPNQTD